MLTLGVTQVTWLDVVKIKEEVKTDDYSQRKGFCVRTGALVLPKMKGENV